MFHAVELQFNFSKWSNTDATSAVCLSEVWCTRWSHWNGEKDFPGKQRGHWSRPIMMLVLKCCLVANYPQVEDYDPKMGRKLTLQWNLLFLQLLRTQNWCRWDFFVNPHNHSDLHLRMTFCKQCQYGFILYSSVFVIKRIYIAQQMQFSEFPSNLPLECLFHIATV